MYKACNVYLPHCTLHACTRNFEILHDVHVHVHHVTPFYIIPF